MLGSSQGNADRLLECIIYSYGDDKVEFSFGERFYQSKVRGGLNLFFGVVFGPFIL